MNLVRDATARRIALLIAYDGTDFHGFARQRDRRTVQGVLEERLSLLLRTDVRTTGAGRTDAGVHASGQVVSFAASASVEPDWVQTRLNRWLAPEVSVRGAAIVPADFDARFSATGREYEYRVYRGDSPDPFRDRFAVHVPGPVSVAAMRAAAKALIGEHDFSAFCKRSPGRSPVRRVRALRVVTGTDALTFHVAADSFCHQMVRSIVGTLLEVGQGKRPGEDVEDALASRDRARAGAVAPARGLHLVRVRYARWPFRGVA